MGNGWDGWCWRGIETAGAGVTVETVGIGTVGGRLGRLALGMALKHLGIRLVLLRWIGLAGVVASSMRACAVSVINENEKQTYPL